MIRNFCRPVVLASLVCGAIAPPLIASHRAEKAVIDAFMNQVDSTLVVKGFSLNRLGSVRLKGSPINVYVYEAIFGESQRVTRRLVFMDARNKFLGMYGNFSESAIRITGGKIYFEPDPAYKNEDCIILSRDRLPSRIKFRGEEFELFGFREVK